VLFYIILFLLSRQPENVKPCIFNTPLVVFSFTKVLFEATLSIGRGGNDIPIIRLQAAGQT